jgi:hypothetical protein
MSSASCIKDVPNTLLGAIYRTTEHKSILSAILSDVTTFAHELVVFKIDEANVNIFHIYAYTTKDEGVVAIKSEEILI